jgi:uncharacterized protein (UPF0297 family)
MFKKLAVLVFALTVFNTVTRAQYKTGDGLFDQALVIIEADAKKDPGLFSKEMAAAYKVPETTVKTMTDSGMKGGDIYMALETSKVTKKPVDEVVKVYEANKEKGWGAISKELGIKPGSPEFHAMKNNADSKAKKSKSNKKASKSKPKAKN